MQSSPPSPPSTRGIFQPEVTPMTNPMINRPHREPNLAQLLSVWADRPTPDSGVPLFQPRPIRRPIQIRDPNSEIFHVNPLPIPLSSPVQLMPHRVTELRSPPRAHPVLQRDSVGTNIPRSNSPNRLASPLNIVPRVERQVLRFSPAPNEAYRPEIIVAKRGLNPMAPPFIPSWLSSPPLFSSSNPYRYYSPDSNLGSTPGLTPDHSPLLMNAPRRALDYTTTPELSPEFIESIKAELVRNPPILVPSEHPKRPSLGLFLHGTPPPGLTRHTACNPYHPSGLMNLPLPPVRFVEDPLEDNVRFHSVGMIDASNLKDTVYIQGDGDLFWRINSELVWSDFVAREPDPFSFGQISSM